MHSTGLVLKARQWVVEGGVGSPAVPPPLAEKIKKIENENRKVDQKKKKRAIQTESREDKLVGSSNIISHGKTPCG
jgi:hypothetical protein